MAEIFVVDKINLIRNIILLTRDLPNSISGQLVIGSWGTKQRPGCGSGGALSCLAAGGRTNRLAA